MACCGQTTAIPLLMKGDENMSAHLTPDLIVFRDAVHLAMLGEGVFPIGHLWEGFTRAESEELARRGYTPEQAQAERQAQLAQPVKGKEAGKDAGSNK